MTDRQQERVIFECEQCDGEIYEGNIYLEYENCIFCDDECLETFVMDEVMSEATEGVA